MADRIYYCICDSGCKFETMTKEQILAAITQAIETGEIRNVDTGFVTKLKEQNSQKGVSIWVGTQAQYNAIATSDIKDGCLYIITDDDEIDNISREIEQIKKSLEKINSITVETANKIVCPNDITTDETWLDIPLAVTGGGTAQMYYDDNLSYSKSKGKIIGKITEADAAAQAGAADTAKCLCDIEKRIHSLGEYSRKEVDTQFEYGLYFVRVLSTDVYPCACMLGNSAGSTYRGWLGNNYEFYATVKSDGTTEIGITNSGTGTGEFKDTAVWIYKIATL